MTIRVGINGFGRTGRALFRAAQRPEFDLEIVAIGAAPRPQVGPGHHMGSPVVSSLRRVVVGVDGSPSSTRALTWAAALTGTTGGELVAVHALGLLTHLADDCVVPSAHHRRDIAALFERVWCKPLIDGSVAHRCVLIDGDPVTALLRAAREQRAELIVVGARGTGDHPGLLLGSTSLQLVSEADRPVTVVPLRGSSV